MDVTKTPQLTLHISWAYLEVQNPVIPMVPTPILALSGHPRPADKHVLSPYSGAHTPARAPINPGQVRSMRLALSTKGKIIVHRYFKCVS